MRKITATLCLTIAVLLGSVGCEESADFQKGYTAYKSGDFATALRNWTPLAEQGHATAQYNLGLMYRNGKGVPQNHKTAVKWYRLAAEQGNADAQGLLGAVYVLSTGVRKDNSYAYMWLILAAANGNAEAEEMRDLISQKMTPTEISTANDRARECVLKKYKGC